MRVRETIDAAAASIAALKQRFGLTRKMLANASRDEECPSVISALVAAENQVEVLAREFGGDYLGT